MLLLGMQKNCGNLVRPIEAIGAPDSLSADERSAARRTYFDGSRRSVRVARAQKSGKAHAAARDAENLRELGFIRQRYRRFIFTQRGRKINGAPDWSQTMAAGAVFVWLEIKKAGKRM